MKKVLVFLCILALFSGGSFAHAVGDSVVITQGVIGTDTTPPSVPINVQAVAVSTTQITVTWDASTDDVSVDGYRVFRGGFQIATTTLTSYADTGLTPNTLYSYTVRAFDVAGNISAHSATSSATTDAVVVPPTPSATSTSSSQGGAGLRLGDLLVRPEQYSADISWSTTIPTKSIVRWGMTRDYEIASLEERSLHKDHSTRLTSLLPGTKYFFQITSSDRYGRETVLFDGSFFTEALPDIEAPVNVRNLVGSASGDDATLSWQNPANSDFSYVRVVRRLDGFPVDPYDGLIVYEGGGEEFRDEGVFASFDRAQYAVFAYDRRGNAASGALVRIQKAGSVPPPTEYVPGDVPVIGFKDLVFVQGGKQVSYIGNEVAIDGGEPLEIRILYERLPEHLKTIVVTLASPEDVNRTFSFLLRVNGDKSAYTAVLAPLGDGGDYQFSVSILDYSQKTITELVGTLLVEGHEGADGVSKVGVLQIFKNLSSSDSISWISFLLFGLLMFVAIAHRIKGLGKKILR